jgi:hypothetical protein
MRAFPSRPHSGAAWLIAVVLFSLPALAQDTSPAPHQTLADLAQHPETWPHQVTLKADVPMDIIAHGQKAGSMLSPAGTTVDLVSITDTAVQIRVLSARASISPDQTDLWERLATSAAAKSAITNTAASPAATPASPPVPTAPPPASPSPSPAPAAAEANADAGPPILLDAEITPRDNFTKAAFRFWTPAYHQPIRGIIVLVPGFDGDGRGMITAPAWQSLARKYRLALVSCFMQGPGYHEAARGTGDALLEALKQFADKSSRPEVAQAPLLLYGESAGGQFDYNFTLWKPERVMVFVVNKGGYYDGSDADSHACAVPGLFFLGLKDTDLRIHAITGIYTAGRKNGALWALAPQPNSGHEFSKTAAVARPFFDAVLKNRLPDDNAASDDPTAMKPMQETQGWLGDPTTHEIHDASTDGEPNRNDSWFPDQLSAQAWKAFVSN